VIGSSLAKALSVKVGGEIAVLTQGMYGSIGAARFRVRGIYNTGNEMVDSLQAFITQNDANALLSSDGRVTTVAIKLADREMTESVVKTVTEIVGDEFEVKGWRQLLPEVAQSIAFHEALARVVMYVFFGIIAIGVTNTMLMSVMERVREFGVMMAIGTSPAQVFRIVLYEGLLVGFVGLVVGLAIGYTLCVYFGSSGIDVSGQLKAAQGGMRGVTGILYPEFGMGRMFLIVTTVLLVMVAATFYPAWKIARLAPLIALQGGAQGFVGDSARVSGRRQSRIRLLALALGVRNLARHPMRSGLTIFAITFGLAAYIFLGGFTNGFYMQMVENATGMVSGDAQIQHQDFKTDLNINLSLPNSDNVWKAVAAIPEVVGASPRIQTLAMASSAERSEAIMLIGIDPPQEEKVTFLRRAVVEGRYLHSGNDKEIVVGKKLAALLHIRVGERLIVMAQGAKGDLASAAFTVVGVFDTRSEAFDKTIVHITLSGAQKMLDMGDRVTGIALRVQDREQIEPVLGKLTSQIANGSVKVWSWRELLPEVHQMSVVIKRSLFLIITIVFLMVVVVVMNTVLMSVLERTREFGVMLALGSKPGLILRLVLFESAAIGVLGALAGAALGSFITLAHATRGVNLKSHGMTAIPGTTDIVFPKLSAAVLLEPSFLLPVIVVLAAVYPAIRASRMQPVIAIRHA
jgi:putative ABC transport system permease protein